MHCTNCGKRNPEDSKFCEHCGETLRKSVPIEKVEHHLAQSPQISSRKTPSSGRYIGLVVTVAITIIAYVAVRYVVSIGVSSIFDFLLNPASRSVSDLQTMTCKQFLSLNWNDETAIVDKLYTAKYNQTQDIYAAAVTVGNLKDSCNNQLPDMTLGQLNY